MGLINFVGGIKGGVGKTFFTRCLREYYELQGWEFQLIDADSSIADVATVYDAIKISISDNPHKYSEPDIIFAKAMQERSVLVNLPSGNQDALYRWMDDNDLLGLAKGHGVTLLYWFVTDGCHSSIQLLEQNLKVLGGQLPHVLIRNEGRLNGPDFKYLDRSDQYQRIIQSPNLIRILDFPVLGSEEQYLIDQNNLGFMKSKDRVREDLGIMSAQRVAKFIDRFIDLFNQVDFQGVKTEAKINTKQNKKEVAHE